MTSFQKRARVLGCLLVLAVATTWTGCSTLNTSSISSIDNAKLKREVSKDRFPSAAEAGVAFASDS